MAEGAFAIVRAVSLSGKLQTMRIHEPCLPWNVSISEPLADYSCFSIMTCTLLTSVLAGFHASNQQSVCGTGNKTIAYIAAVKEEITRKWAIWIWSGNTWLSHIQFPPHFHPSPHNHKLSALSLPNVTGAFCAMKQKIASPAKMEMEHALVSCLQFFSSSLIRRFVFQPTGLRVDWGCKDELFLWKSKCLAACPQKSYPDEAVDSDVIGVDVSARIPRKFYEVLSVVDNHDSAQRPGLGGGFKHFLLSLITLTGRWSNLTI